MPRKNPFAKALAERRWRNTPAEERSAINKKAAARRFAGMTPLERSAYMRELVNRRWSARKAAAK